MKNKTNLLILLLVFSNICINAELRVASILGDNMVLQRNSEVKLWGTANPNETVTILASWTKTRIKTTSNENGHWLVKVKTGKAGGPYEMTFKAGKESVKITNILFGEVWICSGQSNMQMPVEGFTDQPINGSFDLLMNANNDKIRLFTVGLLSIDTPQDTCRGKWSIANAKSVAKFSAVGYLYAKQLFQGLNIPIGMISTNWGGSRVEAWMDKETLSNYPEALAETSTPKTTPNQRASALYNGMISPILNYKIKGAIWYQGESNVTNYNQYADMLNSMVSNWRNKFDSGDFPFYYVQITPFAYVNRGNSQLLREQQVKALSMIKNSGMASTIDLGNETSIHPSEKVTVGKRLAAYALAETYQFEGLPYKTPEYKNVVLKDSVATIQFENASQGLTTFGKTINCVVAAGSDSVFYPATAKIISKGQLRVTSDRVKHIIAVRYAFSNFPRTEGYLYNTLGLPVPSFRTDNWVVK
ncbi:MAG: sialate O-acetylesterase [Bacteroidales bacterium]